MIQEFEIWWLISYPIVFALGWFAARIDLKQLLSESRSVSTSYFLGLKFLLSEQTDKAVETFHKIVRQEGEDNVELFFALAGLFRRRGEYERAIRLHQDLIERQDLSDNDRLNARFELAMDYYKAGMLDRAETMFLDLMTTPKRQTASKILLDIYQTEKSWQKAIEVSLTETDESIDTQNVEVAHFYCELAQNALTHGKFVQAEAYANQALGTNRHSVRANLILGDIAVKEGNDLAAIDIYNRVELQNPDYLAMVAPKLIDVYRRQDRLTEGYDLLYAYLTQYPSMDLLDIVFDLAKEIKGNDEAFEIVRDFFKKTPSLLGLDKFIEAELAREANHIRRSDLEAVKQLVYQQSRGLAKYHCDNCGFLAKQFYWRCPGCGQWETYSPKRTEESAQAL